MQHLKQEHMEQLTNTIWIFLIELKMFSFEHIFWNKFKYRKILDIVLFGDWSFCSYILCGYKL